MNWLDYVLIVWLAFSAIRSFRRGFSREVIGLVSSIAALVLGMWFYGTAAGFFSSWVSSTRLANLLGFFAVVALVLLLGSLIGHMVSRFLSAIGLSFFDRLAGAAFGLIRGIMIVVALLTAYMAFGGFAEKKTTPAAVVHSRITPYLLEASRVAVDAAPMELKKNFRDAYDLVQSEWRSAFETIGIGSANKGSVKDPVEKFRGKK